MSNSAFPVRVLDAGAVGLSLFGVYLALFSSESPSRPGEWPGWWWIDLAGGVAASFLVLLRRRHPVGLAVGLAVLTVPIGSAWIAGIVATFALAVRRPWPLAVGLTVVGWFLAPLTDVVRGPTTPPTSWSDLAWGVAITVAVLTSGVAVRARHELMDSLVERAERAETEAALRAEAARTAERTRIAREMHDVLAHRLSMVSLHAGALAHRRHPSPEEVRDALEVIREGARDALTDLRAILGVLRDPDDARDARDGRETDAGAALPPPQPTLADLDRLVDDVRAAGTTVRLRDERAAGAPPDECGRTLYRITQEALTNATRHAPGRPVEIVLRGAPGDDVELEISNPLAATVPVAPDGSGGSSGGSSGNGLLGITERVELAGGTVLARGAEGDAFRVAVRVPWPAGPVRRNEDG